MEGTQDKAAAFEMLEGLERPVIPARFIALGDLMLHSDEGSDILYFTAISVIYCVFVRSENIVRKTAECRVQLTDLAGIFLAISQGECQSNHSQ